MEIYGDACHDLLVKNMTHELSFDEKEDYKTWKKKISAKLNELLGMDLIRANAKGCPVNFEIESEEAKDGYHQIRFTFTSEPGAVVPCYLLVPDTGKKKYPVAITLQGHSSGFHNSVGIVKYDSDVDYQPRGQFAVQAVKRGYVALAIEQRGMGERKPDDKKSRGKNCQMTAMRASMLGRTIIGERVWDVTKAIDVLTEHFPVCDVEKVFITGNSGGGTVSYYAACIEERIKLSVPSCSVCTYEASILEMLHCTCNYIPNAYRYFEMQDIACMIAPRRLVMVCGVDDSIFPIDGARKAYDVIQKIYKAEGVPDNCRMVVTPKNHWWCVDIVWDAIAEEIKKMGW